MHDMHELSPLSRLEENGLDRLSVTVTPPKSQVKYQGKFTPQDRQDRKSASFYASFSLPLSVDPEKAKKPKSQKERSSESRVA